MLDGFGEVFEALVGVAGHAGEQGHAVEGIVGLGGDREDLAEVHPGVVELAFVEQGDSVVVLLFGVGEVVFAFGHLHEACVDVDADAVGELGGCGKQHLVEGGVRLLVFALLHKLESSLVAGERGGAACVELLCGSSGENAGAALGGRGGSGYGFGMCHESSPEVVRSRYPLALGHGRLGDAGLPSYTQRWARGQGPGRQVGEEGRGDKNDGSGGGGGVAVVEDWIELGVVVHLELAVEAEAAGAGEDLGPEAVEALGEVETLLVEDGEALHIALVMSVGGVRAVRFFRGVVDLQREDGEAVDDEAGGLGVKRSFGVLVTGEGEEAFVDALDEIVAALVDPVDGVLDFGDAVVGHVGAAGFVFFVPEVEIGAVLGEDEVEQLGGVNGTGCAGMPGGVGVIV